MTGVMAPQRRNRESSIIDATAKLFAQRGYQGTTMDDIAAAVKLNKGTLYHYFPGKAELLAQIYEESIDLVQTSFFKHDAALTPPDRVRAIVTDLVRAIERKPHHTTVYLQEMQWLDEWLPRHQHTKLRAREDQIRDYIVDAIDSGVESGEFTVPSTFLAAMGLMGMACWTYRWYRPSGPLTMDDVASGFSDLVLAGLTTRH
jgi:AcrR family transcriptional regulator